MRFVYVPHNRHFLVLLSVFHHIYLPCSYTPFVPFQESGAVAEAEWNAMLVNYQKAHPDLAAELQRVLSGRLPDGTNSV